MPSFTTNKFVVPQLARRKQRLETIRLARSAGWDRDTARMYALYSRNIIGGKVKAKASARISSREYKGRVHGRLYITKAHGHTYTHGASSSICAHLYTERVSRDTYISIQSRLLNNITLNSLTLSLSRIHSDDYSWRNVDSS